MYIQMYIIFMGTKLCHGLTKPIKHLCLQSPQIQPSDAQWRFGSMDPAHVEEVEDAMCDSTGSGVSAGQSGEEK